MYTHIHIVEDLIVMKPVQFFIDYLDRKHPTSDIMMFRDTPYVLV